MKKESLNTLFKKLSSENIEKQNDPWDEFEVRLQKQMFYKFSWNRFNVFYLTIFSLSVLSNIFLLCSYIHLKFSESSRKNQISIYSDTLGFKKVHINEKNKSILEEVTVGKVEKTSNNELPSSYQKDVVKNKIAEISTDKSNNTLQEQQLQQSNVPINKDTINIPLKPIVVKRKSTIYISKRDTIVTIDTVKVKKRR